MIDSKLKYESDIFIYKENKESFILMSLIADSNKFIINKKNDKSEFKKFISKNKIKENSLILIENYLLEKKAIKFNNMTLFNLVKLEYLEDYFKNKLIKTNESTNFNQLNKGDNYIHHQINIKYNNNIVFLKVIDIEENYFIGIDYTLNLFKIYKDSEKLKDINDVYEIVLIKNFDIKKEDQFLTLTLNGDSYINIFENSFCDMLLNDISVINFNFLDFILPQEKNVFNQIRIGNNNFSFKISKVSEYVIIKEKFNFDYNYYPIMIGLIKNNNKEIECFQFLLYAGLLNNVNCFINYDGKYKFGYEYFYYNFSFNLPKIHIINLDGKEYSIHNFDNFNSKTRKRFIILNYYDKGNNQLYSAMKEQIEKDKKEIKDKNKNDEKQTKTEKKTHPETNNIKEISIDQIFEENYEMIQTKINLSLQFCFLYENEKPNIFGIFEIDEINSFNFNEKRIYKQKDEYKIFFDYLNIIKKNNAKSNEKNEDLKLYKKYENDSEIKELATSNEINFFGINYENFIIIINICLFYYMNQTSFKEELIKEFNENFNILKDSKLSFPDRVRIMRFICQQYIIYSKEKRKHHLLIMENLTSKNAYKIAINFNKKMINNLKEDSKLFIPFLQLDSYILFNYFIGAESYTFSLEPLILTKKHLLSSYDDFIFSFKEKQKNNQLKLACQNRLNDITAINEYCLFTLFNECDSDLLLGNDLAVPISSELLHERNGHSKKVKKNRRRVSPLYFYTRRSLKKVDEDFRKIDKEDEGEAGLLVEYFIKYKDDKIIKRLKENHRFGKIIQNINLFTSRSFKELKEEIDKMSNDKEQNSDNEGQNTGFSDKCEVQPKNIAILREKSKEELEDKKLSNNATSDYEKKHLFNGKYFVYPDSLPINYITIKGTKKNEDKNNNNNNMKMLQEKKEYLEKYKNEINEGRKSHYGEYN